ncbi:DUF6281 family protein [Streptomyces sp. NPDC090106]|uniref:DUF6281 family protein n=1 Tax=Streptomyces sp. NPDC090106 TaxID=3365946 RepID=UPI0038159FFB
MTITRGALLATALLLTAATGCTENTGSASCAGLVTYDGRDYLPSGEEIGLTVGEKLGSATVEACDDTPGDPGDALPKSRTGAYAVEGADPARVIAVGDTPSEAVLMREHH